MSNERLVARVDIETGEVTHFASSADAARAIGCSKSTVQQRCNGKQKTPVMGRYDFKWESDSTRKDYGGLTVKEPRLTNIWSSMIHRCENPKRNSYKNYGGRGISVCEEWHDLSNFVEWARSNGYSDNLTLDRIDFNGNYEPSNCRWATVDMQLNNMRTNVVITCMGFTGTAKQWSDLLGISQYTIYGWVKNHDLAYASSRVLETIRNGGIVKQTVTKKCSVCGASYVTPAQTTRSKRCPECQRNSKNEKNKEWMRKRRATERGAKADGLHGE